jgi:hypothetical protein
VDVSRALAEPVAILSKRAEGEYILTLDERIPGPPGPTETRSLACGSVAIDRGINASASANDQRGAGFARTFDDPNTSNAVGGDGTDAGAFEVQAACPHPSTNKDQCKNNGWQSLSRADGTPFKNQGDCIQYVNTGK